MPENASAVLLDECLYISGSLKFPRVTKLPMQSKLEILNL